MGGEGSGDSPGHEFRGNQYTSGGGGATTPDKLELKNYTPQRVNHVNITPEIQKKALKGLERAREIEPELTRTIISLADKHGGTPQGLKFRLKSKESAESEIGTKMREQKVTAEKALEDLTDLNRYTLSFDDDDYVEKTNTVVKELKSKGWNVYKGKQRNYWRPSTVYKGYNVVFTNGKDVFELQLHTHNSYKMKMVNHPVFELHRTEDNPVKRLRYAKMMIHTMNMVPIPRGTDNLVGVKR